MTRMLGTRPLKPSDLAVMAGHLESMPPRAFVNFKWMLGTGDLQIHVTANRVSGVKVVTPGTVACLALCPWGFSRQEYWSGLPCPSPGDLPNPRDWTQVSRTAGGFFTVWATGGRCKCDLVESRTQNILFQNFFQNPEHQVLFPHTGCTK